MENRLNETGFNSGNSACVPESEPISRHEQAEKTMESRDRPVVHLTIESKPWFGSHRVSMLLHQAGSLFHNACKEVNERMEEDINEKLDAYLELLAEVKEKTDDEITARVLFQELSKDLRMERIKKERQTHNSSRATDKQRQFMKKLNIEFPENITKQEASMLIDEELGKNGD